MRTFLGQQIGRLSWKLDGLTLVATYQNGKLESLVTRGNGLVGEDITRNLKLQVGDHVTVYKANMIIPQIAKNEDANKHIEYHAEIPRVCPVCGGLTKVVVNANSNTGESEQKKMLKERNKKMPEESCR